MVLAILALFFSRSLSLSLSLSLERVCVCTYHVYAIIWIFFLSCLWMHSINNDMLRDAHTHTHMYVGAVWVE